MRVQLDADMLRSVAHALDVLGKAERDTGVRFATDVDPSYFTLDTPGSDTVVTIRRSETSRVDPGDGGKMIPVYLAEMPDRIDD